MKCVLDFFSYLLQSAAGRGVRESSLFSSWRAGHTLGKIEVGHGNHVTLADIIISAVLFKCGLEGFGCLLLIEDRILVDVG
jgi:hypothetical protein